MVVLGLAAAMTGWPAQVAVAVAVAWLVTALGAAAGLAFRNAEALRFAMRRASEDPDIRIHVWRDYFPGGLPENVWTGGIEPFFVILYTPNYGSWDAIQIGRHSSVIFCPWTPEDLREENPARFCLLHEMGHIGPRNQFEAADVDVVIWRGLFGCLAVPVLLSAETVVGYGVLAALLVFLLAAPVVAVSSEGEPRLRAEAEADHFSLIAMRLWSEDAMIRAMPAPSVHPSGEVIRRTWDAQRAVLDRNPLADLRMYPPDDPKLTGDLQKQVRRANFDTLREALRLHPGPSGRSGPPPIFPPPDVMLRNVRRVIGPRMGWRRMNVLVGLLACVGVATPFLVSVVPWEEALVRATYLLLCCYALLGGFALLLGRLGGIVYAVSHYSPATLARFLERRPAGKGRVLHATIRLLTWLVGSRRPARPRPA